MEAEHLPDEVEIGDGHAEALEVGAGKQQVDRVSNLRDLEDVADGKAPEGDLVGIEDADYGL